MRSFGSPFSLCLFEPGDSSSDILDEALRIYRDNTSPLLITRSNQIRVKVASPLGEDGSAFFFAALMRSKTPVGFAMFGHYPSRRLLVVDHLVVDRHCRGENAFYAFAQLLREAIDKLRLEFDFTVVEVEKGNAYGGAQTGGPALVRLLGHIGFCEVHADYRIADLEPGRPDGHPGVLMLRGPERIHRMHRRDLVAIHEGVLFAHYLPWCRTFLGERTAAYQRDLEKLQERFRKSLPEEVPVNGAEEDGLLPGAIDSTGATSRTMSLRHLAGYTAMVAVTMGAALTLRIDAAQVALLLVVALGIYAGIELLARGKAELVFDRALIKLPGGTRKLPSPPKLPTAAAGKRNGPVSRSGSRDPHSS